MRRLLIAAALGLGVISAGAATRPAEAAPFNPGQVQLGAGVTPVQYYYGPPRRYYYGPPRRYYGPPRHYYGPPRRYGYYAPPPPPRYWRPRHHHRYYGWRY